MKKAFFIIAIFFTILFIQACAGTEGRMVKGKLTQTVQVELEKYKVANLIEIRFSRTVAAELLRREQKREKIVGIPKKTDRLNSKEEFVKMMQHVIPATDNTAANALIYNFTLPDFGVKYYVGVPYNSTENPFYCIVYSQMVNGEAMSYIVTSCNVWVNNDVNTFYKSEEHFQPENTVWITGRGKNFRLLVNDADSRDSENAEVLLDNLFHLGEEALKEVGTIEAHQLTYVEPNDSAKISIIPIPLAANVDSVKVARDRPSCKDLAIEMKIGIDEERCVSYKATPFRSIFPEVTIGPSTKAEKKK